MNRFHRLLPLFAALAFVVPAFAVSAFETPATVGGFDRVAWQDDFAVLKRALQRDYANLAWFGSTQGGVDLPALDRQVQRALASAENDAQAEQALRDFVAGFGDGHFSFVLTLDAHTDGPADKVPDIADADLAAMDAAAGCAASGYAPAQRAAWLVPLSQDFTGTYGCFGVERKKSIASSVPS